MSVAPIPRRSSRISSKSRYFPILFAGHRGDAKIVDDEQRRSAHLLEQVGQTAIDLAPTRAERVLERVQRGGKRRQLNVAKSPLQIEHGWRSGECRRQRELH